MTSPGLPSLKLSRMTIWKKFASLTFREKWLVVQALIGFLLCAAALRLLSFQRLTALVERLVPLGQTPSHGNHIDARRLAWLVGAAAARGPYRANCMKRSLVLWVFLRRDGFDSSLVIGVRKQGEKFDAHAWVEYDGVVLNDRLDIAEVFAPSLRRGAH